MTVSTTHSRRRRWLSLETQEQSTFESGRDRCQVNQHPRYSQAFQTLSRDQLVRKLLSDRVWKHAVISLTLCSSPLSLSLFFWLGLIPDAVARWLKSGPLWALTGMELFACALLCILIAAVRSASCIDFRGNYRSWKWLSGFLLACAFLLLSHSASAAAGGLAMTLQSLTGPLQASRPALLIVPAAAFLAHILRIVLPDMGQCRWAQGLLSCSVLLAIICVVFAVRLQNSQDTPVAVQALTASGFLLSALLLHTRFVIHVNPNPPLPTGVTSQGAVNASTIHHVLLTSASDFSENDPNTIVPQVDNSANPAAIEEQPHIRTAILNSSENSTVTAEINHADGSENEEHSQAAVSTSDAPTSRRLKSPGKRARKSA